MSYHAKTPIVLQYLYPDSSSPEDWIVSRNNSGRYIAHWNDALGAKPSEQQILDNLLLAKRAILKKRIQKEADRRIDAAEGRLEQKLYKLMQAVFLIRREAAGTITAGQLATLDALDAKAVQLFQVRNKEKQNQDAVDTMDEIAVDGYDETDDGNWT